MMNIKTKVETGDGMLRVLTLADGTMIIQKRFLFFFWASLLKVQAAPGNNLNFSLP